MALTARVQRQRAEDLALAASRRTEPAIARAFVDAVARATGGTLRARLEQLLQSGHLDAALAEAERAWTAASPAFRIEVAAQLRTALEAGAAAALTAAPTLVGRFDVVNPAAVAWAAERAAALVTRVSADVRTTIRTAVSDAILRGQAPRDLAAVIQRSVGLLPRQTAAVQAFREALDRLQAAPPGTTRETHYARVSNRNLPDTRVESLVTRYSDRLLRQRATTIARTETLAAVNAGQRLAWRQAVASGTLDAAAVERVWIVTHDERLCDACDALDGATAPLGGTFPDDGEDGPPLHPNCRCTEGLISAVDAKA